MSEDLKVMYRHLRRAFEAPDAIEFLTGFFPQQISEIQELRMSEVQDEVTTTKTTKPVKAKRVTNMAQARILFEKAEDKSRKAIINLFMDTLGQTQAVASTYFYQVAPKSEKTSNVSKARALYAAAEDKTRKTIVALFQAELGQTENVASTYFYNCRKHFAALEAASQAPEIAECAPGGDSLN